MSTILKVDNLSKRYLISHKRQECYAVFRDVFVRRMKRMFVKKETLNSTREEFLALKDINFELKKGDRLGIIGRNGAGKSTLLKILSRITEPTQGRIYIKGRVSSLLEVGTGFHPELTGRENIFLNGAILGMSNIEIKRRFDEIVAFAEIEKFLDTPVKRYSSGMYVRLAFAVAAHLDPDILVVDEVLAVGDAQFQKKCLMKMESVSEEEGRTILFVSHNMATIKKLCNIGILLEQGKVASAGRIMDVVKAYETSGLAIIKSTSVLDMKRGKGLPLWAKISGVDLSNEDGETLRIIDSKKPFTIKLTVVSEVDTSEKVSFGIRIQDQSQCLVWSHSAYQNKMYALKKGVNIIECAFSPTFLTGGDYFLKCWIYCPLESVVVDMLEEAYYFSVYALDPFNNGFPLQQSACVYDVPYVWKSICYK